MPLSHHYAMACIFPTGIELDPIKAILDQIRSSLPTQKNSYTLGEVDGHNTIAVLPEIGTDSAATAARQMKELLSVISPGDATETSSAADRAQILTALQSNDAALPSSTMPFRRDADFVDRGTFLEQIEQRYEAVASRVALVGIGGAGKSQLAIEYCYRLRARSPHTWVFWIHASNADRIEQGYREIAERVKIPGRKDPQENIFELVARWLRDDATGNWLLVLDNLDDDVVLSAPYTIVEPKMLSGNSNGQLRRSFSEYLPQSKNGAILVTTRTRNVAMKLVEPRDVILVDSMTTSEAIRLLQIKLDGQADIGVLGELVYILECIPLAIVQAAAYIQQKGARYSVRQYIEAFRRSEKQTTSLLNHEAGHLRRDAEAKNSIIVTWQISFDDIREKWPLSADLLSLMSYFDRQGIPEEVLKIRLPEEETGDLISQEEGAVRDQEKEKDEDVEGDSASQASGMDIFEEAVDPLLSYSLVSIGKDRRTFEMHGLVQLATRKWLQMHRKDERWKARFCRKLNAVFPTGDHENWDLCEMLFPHAKSAERQRPTDSRSVREWAQILRKAGWYAWAKGHYGEAERMCEKSAGALSKILGGEDVETSYSLGILAMVYRHQGRWTESEKIFMQVMETRRRVLGEEHPSTLSSMANLATTYWNQGRWTEAETMNVQVMETRRRVLGEEHPDTLTSIANLALTYWNQGRWTEAETMQVQVMETSRRVLGEEHPDTLGSMANLASTYWNQGRWTEAETIEVQVMETRRRVLGEEHPDTLTSIANLALTYWNQGRWTEAETMQVQVMETSRRVLGEEHPDTVTSMASLATTYRNQGRWTEAERMLVHVMETSRRVLGEEHPDTVTSMASLATTYRNQGRWTEAERMLVHVMETSRRVLGEEHPDTVTSMASLASTYRDQGRWTEAEKMFIQVVEMRKRVLGEEHPDTVTSMASLASTYRDQGRWTEAEKMFIQVVEMRKRVLGEEHPDTVTSMASLASTYRDQGRWTEAEKMFIQVVEMRKRVLGEEHPDTVTSMANLASTYRDQGRWTEAEKMFVHVMEMRKRMLGEEHPDTVTSMNDLASIYRDQERLPEAEKDSYLHARALYGTGPHQFVQDPDAYPLVRYDPQSGKPSTDMAGSVLQTNSTSTSAIDLFIPSYTAQPPEITSDTGIYPSSLRLRIKVSLNSTKIDEFVLEGFPWSSATASDQIHESIARLLRSHLSTRSGTTMSDQELRFFYFRWGDVHLQLEDGSAACERAAFLDETSFLEVSTEQMLKALSGTDRQIFQMCARFNYSHLELTEDLPYSRFSDVILNQMSTRLTRNFDDKLYIPQGDLKEFLRPRIIQRLLYEDDHAMKNTLLMHEILQKAPRLFAVCIWARVPLTMLERVLKHGFSDTKPPMTRDERVFSSTDSFQTSVFIEAVPKFFAVSIKNDRTLWNIPSESILPIHYDLREDYIGEGAFSRVFRVTIEPTHNQISGDLTQNFALKVFYGKIETVSEAFSREQLMLNELIKYSHGHIVTHLASWVQNNNYHILYPLASENLRQFLDCPKPRQTKSWMLWFFGQLAGLADAVRHIHVILPTSTHDKPDSIRRGYHHDIKPENILVFQDCPAKHVTFKVSDFGAGRIVPHEDNSKSMHTTKRHGTETYAGPELEMTGHASRPFDMWAMGCVFLEMLSWVVHPETELSFSRERYFQNQKGGGLSSGDAFWIRLKTETYSLSPAVELRLRLFQSWPGLISHLGDLVKIIRKLLVIDPLERLDAQSLCNELKAVVVQIKLEPEEIFESPIRSKDNSGTQDIAPPSPKATHPTPRPQSRQSAHRVDKKKQGQPVLLVGANDTEGSIRELFQPTEDGNTMVLGIQDDMPPQRATPDNLNDIFIRGNAKTLTDEQAAVEEVSGLPEAKRTDAVERGGVAPINRIETAMWGKEISANDIYPKSRSSERRTPGPGREGSRRLSERNSRRARRGEAFSERTRIIDSVMATAMPLSHEAFVGGQQNQSSESEEGIRSTELQVRAALTHETLWTDGENHSALTSLRQVRNVLQDPEGCGKELDILERMVYELLHISGVFRDDFTNLGPLLDSFPSETETVSLHLFEAVAQLSAGFQGLCDALMEIKEPEDTEKSFSIIVLDENRDNILNVVPLDISSIRPFQDLLIHLQQILSTDASGGVADQANSSLKEPAISHAIRSMAEMATTTLQYLGFQNFNLGSKGGPSVALSIFHTRVLLKVLAIGMTSYVSSHLGRLVNSLFADKQENNLRLTVSSEYDIQFLQKDLACLAGFIGGSVWAMTTNSEATTPPGCAVSTLLADFDDLWGPVEILYDPDDAAMASRVQTFGGVLYATKVGETSLPRETLCHWSRWIDAKPDGNLFDPTGLLLIGVNNVPQFRENTNCNRRMQSYYQRWDLATLDTSPETVVRDGKAKAIGLGGIPHIPIVLSVTRSYKYIPQINAKNAILQWFLIDKESGRPSRNPPHDSVDQVSGLEISKCTGNAQRLTLWRLLRSPDVVSYVNGLDLESPLPSDWHNAESWQEFRSQNHQEAQRSMLEAIATIIKYLFLTGVNERGEVRAWDIQQSTEMRIVRPNWARMLVDGLHCATFAILSSRCLVYENGRQCALHTLTGFPSTLRSVVMTQIEVTARVFVDGQECQSHHFAPKDYDWDQHSSQNLQESPQSGQGDQMFAEVSTSQLSPEVSASNKQTNFAHRNVRYDDEAEQKGKSLTGRNGLPAEPNNQPRVQLGVLQEQSTPRSASSFGFDRAAASPTKVVTSGLAQQVRDVAIIQARQIEQSRKSKTRSLATVLVGKLQNVISGSSAPVSSTSSSTYRARTSSPRVGSLMSSREYAEARRQIIANRRQASQQLRSGYVPTHRANTDLYNALQRVIVNPSQWILMENHGKLVFTAEWEDRHIEFDSKYDCEEEPVRMMWQPVSHHKDPSQALKAFDVSYREADLRLKETWSTLQQQMIGHEAPKVKIRFEFSEARRLRRQQHNQSRKWVCIVNTAPEGL